MTWKMNRAGRINYHQVVRHFVAGMVLAVVTLAGCQGQTIIDSVFPPTTITATPVLTLTPEVPSLATEEIPTPAHLPARELVIWVSPQFDPQSDRPSARLFANWLQVYQSQNPQVNIQVRVKAASGVGGLLDTLTNASAVAPDSLPALVLLSRADMNQAISKNLLEPMDDFSAIIDEDDWFGFAREMGIQQGNTYGLPFASNLLGIVYRQPALENDQPTWDEVNRRFNRLVFAAGDPEALVTLSLYLSAGGEIRDAQGHPMVDPDDIEKVFTVYAEGSRRGLLPSYLLDLQNDEQSWEFFQSGEGDAVITWAGRVLTDTESLALAMVPSLGEQPYTTATGWLWCLTAVDQAEQEEAVRLAEHMVAPEFLERWSPVSGFFPVRPSSLDGWNETGLKNTANRMLQFAQLRPVRLLTSVITPEMKNSVADILLRQSTPAESAQKLIERLEVIEAQ